MNLPTTITVGRICLAPIVTWLALVPEWEARAAGFCLFVVAAVSDYIDGELARQRNEVTTLGKLLDPLADKLLLAGTLVAMYLLQAPDRDGWALASGIEDATQFPFEFGLREPWLVALPVVVPALVLGRELLMTVFRQVAARKGIVIAAIGPAKWKTAFQSVWVGAAYVWFSALTLARAQGWGPNPFWRIFASFDAAVGTVSMVAAVGLTLWSLVLYARRYGPQVFAR
ncbi:MAG: CDP-alcohol phosphatidyltransferase family protein [Gemmatimonadetes bacterium]|nr:CDP-alcohol phosphatidyltransferase family protein [Gemmatimonadota bacterium]